MQLSGTTSDAKGRGGFRRRRIIVFAITGAVAAMVILGIFVGRAYFRVDLFAAYRAGYASVGPDPSSDDGGTACNAAVQATYPRLNLTTLSHWPDETNAFWLGCNDRRGGLAADPWILHQNLRGSG